MTLSADQRDQFLRDSVMSASPARLVTMMYDRLVLDLDRAAKSVQVGDLGSASAQLQHAQDIVSELLGTLDARSWEGGKTLQALYLHVFSALIAANSSKDLEDIRECREIVDPLRLAWHEAAMSLVQESVVPAARVGRLGELGVA